MIAGQPKSAGLFAGRLKRKAPHAAAAREAREEAGVVGKISQRSIGWFSYEKRVPHLIAGPPSECDRKGPS